MTRKQAIKAARKAAKKYKECFYVFHDTDEEGRTTFSIASLFDLCTYRSDVRDRDICFATDEE